MAPDPTLLARELALALDRAGLVWYPQAGDRFSLRTDAFGGEVFTLADMVVEALGTAEHRVLGFNGTTEWALDSVEFSQALWLPREDQLRELLGSAFRRLERAADGFVVVLTRGADEERIAADTAADAYALALLARLADR